MVRRNSEPGARRRRRLGGPAPAIGVVILVAALAGHAAPPRALQSPTIVQIELADVIHPVSADYLADGLEHADAIGASAVIVRLDTPGGLVDSMRAMVEDILASPVPVIVWVGPSGVRAASAGYFILLSADLALMASGTNTGSAHPVSAVGGEIDETMEAKVVNDAAAFLRSYTFKRDRNPDVAETGVTESRNFFAEEALDLHLIDGVVSDVPGIIRMYDGAQVTRFDGSVQTLQLTGASIELFEMTTRQRLLSAIMNPNLALILGLAGLVGLYVEVTHPGMILPGVIGGISLILALFAFNLLPINLTGLLLIVLAIALFVIEATVPSSGILAMGGIASMIFGGLMLVEGPIPELRIQPGPVVAVAVALGAITIVLVRLVLVSHRKKAVTDQAGLIGATGVASTDIERSGKVRVHGEYWSAHSGTPIKQGSRVRVVSLDGLELEVEAEEA